MFHDVTVNETPAVYNALKFTLYLKGEKGRQLPQDCNWGTVLAVITRKYHYYLARKWTVVRKHFRVTLLPTTHQENGEWGSARLPCSCEVKWHRLHAPVANEGTLQIEGEIPAVDSKHFEVRVASNHWNLHSVFPSPRKMLVMERL